MVVTLGWVRKKKEQKLEILNKRAQNTTVGDPRGINMALPFSSSALIINIKKEKKREIEERKKRKTARTWREVTLVVTRHYVTSRLHQDPH